jgi:hypothetical protein
MKGISQEKRDKVRAADTGSYQAEEDGKAHGASGRASFSAYSETGIDASG